MNNGLMPGNSTKIYWFPSSTLYSKIFLSHFGVVKKPHSQTVLIQTLEVIKSKTKWKTINSHTLNIETIARDGERERATLENQFRLNRNFDIFFFLLNTSESEHVTCIHIKMKLYTVFIERNILKINCLLGKRAVYILFYALALVKRT